MKIKAAGFVLLLAGLSTAAYSQSFEAAVSGGLSQVSDSAGNLGGGYSLDSGMRVAMRMTINTAEHLGYEFGYAYNRTHLGQVGSSGGEGMAIHQGFGGVLLYATREGSRIRPFATGGVHFNNFVPPGATAQYGQGVNKYGFNYGAGVKVKVTGPWQIRFDVRQYNTGKPFDLGGSGRFLQNEISVGVGYTI